MTIPADAAIEVVDYEGSRAVLAHPDFSNIPPLATLDPQRQLDLEVAAHDRWRAMLLSAYSPAATRVLARSSLRRIPGPGVLIDRLRATGALNVTAAVTRPLARAQVAGLLGVRTSQLPSTSLPPAEANELATDIIAGVSPNATHPLAQLLTAAPGQLHRHRCIAFASGVLAFGWHASGCVFDRAAVELPNLLQNARRSRLPAMALRSRGCSEILRISQPALSARGLHRYAAADTTVAGHRIAARSPVIVKILAANHDPDVFASGSAIDLGQQQPHLAFGHGRYRCSFASLAESTLDGLLRRLWTVGDAVPDLVVSAADDPECGDTTWKLASEPATHPSAPDQWTSA